MKRFASADLKKHAVAYEEIHAQSLGSRCSFLLGAALVVIGILGPFSGVQLGGGAGDDGESAVAGASDHEDEDRWKAPGPPHSNDTTDISAGVHITAQDGDSMSAFPPWSTSSALPSSGAQPTIIHWAWAALTGSAASAASTAAQEPGWMTEPRLPAWLPDGDVTFEDLGVYERGGGGHRGEGWSAAWSFDHRGVLTEDGDGPPQMDYWFPIVLIPAFLVFYCAVPMFNSASSAIAAPWRGSSRPSSSRMPGGGSGGGGGGGGVGPARGRGINVDELRLGALNWVPPRGNADWTGGAATQTGGTWQSRVPSLYGGGEGLSATAIGGGASSGSGSTSVAGNTSAWPGVSGNSQTNSTAVLPSEQEVTETYAAFGEQLQRWVPSLVSFVEKEIVEMLLKLLDDSDKLWQQMLQPRGWRLSFEAPRPAFPGIVPAAQELSVFDRNLPKPFSDDPQAVQLWSRRQYLESFFMHPNFEPSQRQCVIDRLREWRHRGLANAMRSDFRTSNTSPTDAHVLENILIITLQTHLDFASCFLSSGHAPPRTKHLGQSPTAYLRQVTDQSQFPRPPPHYEVFTLTKVWKLRPGNSNVLEALALLLHALKRQSRSYQAFPQPLRTVLEGTSGTSAAAPSWGFTAGNVANALGGSLLGASRPGISSGFGLFGSGASQGNSSGLVGSSLFGGLGAGGGTRDGVSGGFLGGGGGGCGGVGSGSSLFSSVGGGRVGFPGGFEGISGTTSFGGSLFSGAPSMQAGVAAGSMPAARLPSFF